MDTPPLPAPNAHPSTSRIQYACLSFVFTLMALSTGHLSCLIARWYHVLGQGRAIGPSLGPRPGIFLGMVLIDFPADVQMVLRGLVSRGLWGMGHSQTPEPCLLAGNCQFPVRYGSRKLFPQAQEEWLFSVEEK